MSSQWSIRSFNSPGDMPSPSISRRLTSAMFCPTNSPRGLREASGRIAVLLHYLRKHHMSRGTYCPIPLRVLLKSARVEYSQGSDHGGAALNMTRPEDQAIYSIGAVARMLDIPTSTLRAWEERYSVITPLRSEGSQ